MKSKWLAGAGLTVALTLTPTLSAHAVSVAQFCKDAVTVSNDPAWNARPTAANLRRIAALERHQAAEAPDPQLKRDFNTAAATLISEVNHHGYLTRQQNRAFNAASKRIVKWGDKHCP
jgi:hypothetical protein